MESTSKRERNWNKTKEALAYRTEYQKTHYSKIQVQVPIEQGKAYREACKAAGIPLSRPLADAIADVISGKYRPI